MKGNILFVPTWKYSFAVLLPVIEELVNRGYTAHVLLADFDQAHVERVRATGAIVHTAAESAAVRRVHPLLRSLRVHDLPVRLATKRAMDALYDDVNPRAVVTLQEKRPLIRPLIRRANERGVPTVLVQWAFTNPKRDYDAQRADLVARSGREAARRGFIFQFRSKADVDIDSAGEAGRDKFLASVFSWLDDLARRLGSATWLARGWIAAYRAVLWPFYRRLGVDYRLSSQSMGGGEATVFTVLGPAFVEQFIREGVDGTKLRVAGLPEHDELFALDDRAQARARRAVCEAFGFDPSRPIAFWAPRASAEDGYDEAMVGEQERTIAEALLARPERFSVVAKLHPRTQVERFRGWLPQSDRLVVLQEYDKGVLLSACDLFVSTYSTVVLSALALDKPVLTYNLLGIPGGDVFAERVGGVAHARTAADVAPCLDSLFGDTVMRERIAAERRRARRTHMVFDGRVVVRLADIVEGELSNV